MAETTNGEETAPDEVLGDILSLFNVGYRNDAINIMECGFEACLPKKPFFPSARDYYTIHYILHGKGYLYVDEKNPVELHAGDMFVLMPDQTIPYYPMQSNPWTYTWIGAYGTIVDKVIELLPLSSARPYIRGEKDRRIQEYFAEVVESYNNSNFLHLKPLAYFELLLSYLIEKHVQVSKLLLSQKQQHIKNVQMFVSCNYKQPLSIKELSQSLGLSSNYLSNIFNEVLGISTKQYIINYKMQKACEFLETGKYSIKEVAAMVGYADYMHFSKEFKKYKAMSPMQYKKRFQ